MTALVPDVDAAVAPTAPHSTTAPAVEDLVVEHLDLARGLASRYRNRGESWDDLVQVAFLGLVKAARGYQPGAGASFAAYATPTITGEIRRHFRDHGWDVRPPRRLQELRSRMRSVERDLEQENAAGADEDALAERLGTSVQEVREARCAAAAYSAVSLDARLGADDDTTVGDTLVASGDPTSVVDDLASLGPVLAELPDRDRRILAMRFFADATQSQIAAELGISQMQVSRLLSAVLHRLRDALAGEPAGRGNRPAASRRAGSPVRVVRGPRSAGHVPTREPGSAAERLRNGGEAVPACSRIPASSSVRTSAAA